MGIDEVLTMELEKEIAAARRAAARLPRANLVLQRRATITSSTRQSWNSVDQADPTLLIRPLLLLALFHDADTLESRGMVRHPVIDRMTGSFV
jgi:hypothetical protein